MFDPSDVTTQKALLELRDIHSQGKPIILWIGAGVSRWAGYPTWQELAEQLHSHFIKYESDYDAKVGAQIIKSGALPSLFSLCKKTNSRRYFEILSSTLANRHTPPVYARLLELISKVNPLMILTTNIDENLEANLPGLIRYQRSNIEFADRAVSNLTPFICKLHGTASEIESTIWTDEDYSELKSDKTFIDTLSRIITRSSTVFLGYSLRDEYVINLLTEHESISRFLGAGPHFLISSNESAVFNLNSVKTIKYITSNHADHRGALTILDLLQNQSNQEAIDIKNTEEKVSAIYLPDYVTFGTWQTSQTITFSDLENRPAGRAFLGNGFVNSEIPGFVTTSLHDLLVGLICFDKIYIPVNSIGKLHTDLGSNLFWELIQNDALRFIWIDSDLSVIFQVGAVANGNISCFTLMDKSIPERKIQFQEVLLKQIKPIVDNEENRSDLVNKIENITIKLDEKVLSQIPKLTQGALISPRLRSSLGIGDAILPTKIPEWFVFPALRVGNVVRDAEICRVLGICSAKMPFASDGLANATYGLAASDIKAGEFASYVVAGKFNANLGNMVMKNPALVRKVIKFRDSNDGRGFRKEIFEQLQMNEGAEFVASVNSALKQSVPLELLERAHSHFADIQLANGSAAIWSSDTNQSDPFFLWRKQSAAVLRDICSRNKIGAYDLCPCGSGDKLKFCCGTLLRDAP